MNLEFTDFSQVTQEMVDQLEESMTGVDFKDYIPGYCYFDLHCNNDICQKIITYGQITFYPCPCLNNVPKEDLWLAATIFLDVWAEYHQK